MKRLALLFAALLLLAPAAWAQSRYYYSDERKIPIERAESGAVVQIPETARTALTDALSRRPGVRLRSALDHERGFYWLEGEDQLRTSLSGENQSEEGQTNRHCRGGPPISRIGSSISEIRILSRLDPLPPLCYYRCTSSLETPHCGRRAL